MTSSEPVFLFHAECLCFFLVVSNDSMTVHLIVTVFVLIQNVCNDNTI